MFCTYCGFESGDEKQWVSNGEYWCLRCDQRIDLFHYCGFLQDQLTKVIETAEMDYE